MTYNDYPESVRNNARRGIELNKRQGNKCATPVGRARATTLAAGEGVSLDVIRRMYSYLSRAEVYYDPNKTTECGTISYLLWGGKAALGWSRNKLRELGEIDLAEVGPRGGIKESPKAPKSKTPNPNPKKGKGKGGDASTGGVAKVPKDVEKTLQNKSDEFNERYKEKLGYGVTVGKLKKVYKRGVGAFQTSHSPNVKSERQWAMARVNAFLYLVKNGRPDNKKYVQDNDLLPEGHPKRNG